MQRKAGWDTHGLPLNWVLKMPGYYKRRYWKKITIEDYNNECKKAVMKYTDIWNDLTKKWAIGLMLITHILHTHQNTWNQFGGFLKRFIIRT